MSTHIFNCKKTQQKHARTQKSEARRGKRAHLPRAPKKPGAHSCGTRRARRSPCSVWPRSVPLPRTMIRPDIPACRHLAEGSPDSSRLTVARWIFWHWRNEEREGEGGRQKARLTQNHDGALTWTSSVCEVVVFYIDSGIPA